MCSLSFLGAIEPCLNTLKALLLSSDSIKAFVNSSGLLASPGLSALNLFILSCKMPAFLVVPAKNILTSASIAGAIVAILSIESKL